MNEEIKEKEDFKKIIKEILDSGAEDINTVLQERIENQPKDDKNRELDEYEIDKILTTFVDLEDFTHKELEACVKFLGKLVYNLRYDVRLFQYVILNLQKVLSIHLNAGEVMVIDFDELIDTYESQPPDKLEPKDNDEMDIGGFYS